MPSVVISDNTGADYSGTSDARIAEGAATTNFGSDGGAFGDLYVTAEAASNRQRSVLRFDGLSSISGPVTVSAASIEIWMEIGGTGTWNIDTHPLTRTFVEGQVTWNIYSTGNSWATAGGRGTGDSDASVGSTSVNTTTGEYKTITLPTSLVQGWINSPSTNYGVLLKSELENGTGGDKQFQTSEGTDGRRPRLNVTYAAAGGAQLIPWQNKGAQGVMVSM